MKAPDKKYPLSVVTNLFVSTPHNKAVFLPNKIYFDGVDTSTIPRLAINAEYIRKDALLEWAKEKAEDYKGTANIRRSFEMMIRKIESL